MRALLSAGTTLFIPPVGFHAPGESTLRGTEAALEGVWGGATPQFRENGSGKITAK